jgi:hypothetical protein
MMRMLPGRIDLTAMKELRGVMLAKRLHAIYMESEAGTE